MNQGGLIQAQPGMPASVDEEFRQLRQCFHVRLRSEQALLATLMGALESGSIASPVLVTSIRDFAHRLRGAALVFEYREIGDDAKAVELAAIAVALDANAQGNDPALVSALNALNARLAGASNDDASNDSSTGANG